MIRVAPQPEPADFDAEVRKPGLAHLPKGGKPTDKQPNFWTECLDDLYRLYGGVCAYYAIHFERVTGTASTDHFAPKSLEPGVCDNDRGGYSMIRTLVVEQFKSLVKLRLELGRVNVFVGARLPDPEGRLAQQPKSRRIRNSKRD